MIGSKDKVWWNCSKGHEWKAAISSRKKAGCPYCKGLRVITGVNDLQTLNPELLKEWNYSRNTDFLPSEISATSAKKVWWLCSKGHEWLADIRNRNAGSGCPICYKEKRMLPKVVEESRSLMRKRSDLLAEWDYSMNTEIEPQMVTPESHKRVWWKCKNGHSWQAFVYNIIEMQDKVVQYALSKSRNDRMHFRFYL